MRCHVLQQQTLAMAADQSGRYRRPTWRDEFLATMERIVPWAELCEVVAPHYPKAGSGRPPVGLERMLRMYFAGYGRHWPTVVAIRAPAASTAEPPVRRHHSMDVAIAGEIRRADQLLVACVSPRIRSVTSQSV